MCLLDLLLEVTGLMSLASCGMSEERHGGWEKGPYAPYLIFMIERVTSYKFDKDGLHTVYKTEKTQASGASRAVRHSSSVEDVSESSRSRSRKDKKIEKFGKWI